MKGSLNLWGEKCSLNLEALDGVVAADDGCENGSAAGYLEPNELGPENESA